MPEGVAIDRPLEGVACGKFMFQGNVPLGELMRVAQQWCASPHDGPRFQQLVVRMDSRGRPCIEFIYEYAREDAEEQMRKTLYAKFVDRFTDQLRRSFGNDLVGWDISQSVMLVKTPWRAAA